MKKFAPVLALAPLMMLGTLAACGDTDDASTAAEAETVEMPADEALAGTTEEPAADANANATAAATEAPTDAATTATAEEAADNAADVAARAQEAAEAAEAATEPQ